MSIYQEWTQTVVDIVRTKGEKAFWAEYSQIEKQFYSKLLSDSTQEVKGKVRDLAVKFGITNVYFVGILDGINDSLLEELDLENITIDSEIELKIDLEKLYFNMLDAKAEYLFGLPQWEEIFTEEKRREIAKKYKDSKTVVKEKEPGRNDACPCGSGKKYKKCCGK